MVSATVQKESRDAPRGSFSSPSTPSGAAAAPTTAAASRLPIDATEATAAATPFTSTTAQTTPTLSRVTSLERLLEVAVDGSEQPHKHPASSPRPARPMSGTSSARAGGSAQEQRQQQQLQQRVTMAATPDAMDFVQLEQLDRGARSSQGFGSRFRSRMHQLISHEESSLPLAWQALLTGMVDALLYSKATVWTGFQTGNMVQFSQNIAQYMLPGAERFPLLTLERVLSVLAFLLGSFFGANLGRRMGGDRRRAYQVLSAALQSALLWGATAILLSRPEEEPPTFRYWPATIALTACAMGMQSIAAQKLVSPAFATTVAFTATLSQVASDPYLFALTLSPVEELRARQRERRAAVDAESAAAADAHADEKPVVGRAAGLEKKPQPRKRPRTLGRDRRLVSLVALCTGAGVAECLLYSSAGVRGGMAVAAGFKLIQAILWLVPQGEAIAPVERPSPPVEAKPSSETPPQDVKG